MLNIQVLEIFIKYDVLEILRRKTFIILHLTIPVTGRITNAVINGIINSAGVLSYREEDSRNPIHYGVR